MLHEFLICFLIIFSAYILFSSLGVCSLIFTYKKNYTLISYFVGKCLFIIFVTFTYEIFKINLKLSLIVFSCISIFCFCFILFEKKNLFKEILLFFFKFYLPIIIIFLFLAYLYGISFYIFRGNHWDWFAQISFGEIFNKYDYKNLLSLLSKEDLFISENPILEVGKPFSKSYYFFAFHETFIYQRKLQGLFLASIFYIDKVNIFLLAFSVKVLFLSSFFSAYYFFIHTFDNSIKVSRIYLTSLALTLSTWSLYLFEIDALAQLSTFPLTLIFFSFIFINFKSNSNDFDKLFIILLLAVGIFFSYPEQAVIIFFATLIFLIIYQRSIFYEKKFYILLIISAFLISPKIHSYFIYLLNVSAASNDWWGYFGSYVLGRENLVMDTNSVSLIREIINNNETSLIFKLKEIYFLHYNNNYSLVILAILPSIIGLYFLVDPSYSILNLIFLSILNLFLLGIIFYNVRSLIILKEKRFQYFRFYLSYFLIISLFFISNNQIYIFFKLVFFFSPFIALFFCILFDKKNKINFVIIILFLFFPIYKFGQYNHGINKYDSFPSILNVDLKKNINWDIDLVMLKKCKNIHVNIDDQVPNIFISLMLDHKKIKYFNNSSYVKKEIKTLNSYDCQLYMNDGNFILKKIN